MEQITIQNTEITLAKPVSFKGEWIGQKEPLRQLLACWHTISDEDMPLTPRLTGYPGTGKTTLAITAARRREQKVYIMQCTSDTRPEDLIITPVLSEKGRIKYHASPLLSAALTGSVVILDEGNRMPEKSWASLTGLLDNRRSLESIIAGIQVQAHPQFRAVVTMNEDSSTFEIPDYITSRLQPGIHIGFPGKDEERAILSYNIPFCEEKILDICVGFLQQAHGLDLPYSIRDGINTIRYVLKQKNRKTDISDEELFENAVKQILGEDALDMQNLAHKRKRAGEYIPDMNLGDFFFGENDSLNPDSPDNFNT